MQKNASQKCKKDAGAKTQCKKNQITGLICFLFAFFLHCCFAVFFFCFCLVFFWSFCAFAQAFATFSRNHVCPAGPWSDLLFFLFLFAFCPGFSTFFRNHVCPVGPWSDLLFFFTFLHFYFLLLSELLFSIVFFLLFLHLFFLLLPRLHSSFACFLLYFYFFQVENLLEQAQFDNTMFTVFALQKKRDTNHQAAARTQPRVAESLSLFPPTKSHQMQILYHIYIYSLGPSPTTLMILKQFQDVRAANRSTSLGTSLIAVIEGWIQSTIFIGTKESTTKQHDLEHGFFATRESTKEHDFWHEEWQQKARSRIQSTIFWH